MKIKIYGDGITAHKALSDAGFDMAAPCGGRGSCGKCKIKLTGALDAPSADERKRLGDDFERGYRLACQAILRGEAFAETEDEARMEVLTQTGGAIIGSSPIADEGYAVAVDIGTTTLAVYLCDLGQRRVIAERGIRNPQASFGADVITRMTHIIENDGGLSRLHDILWESVSAVVAEMCPDISAVKYICAAGNTVMQCIADNIDPRTIASAPFTAPTLFGEYSANTGINGAPIYYMPCFASYVGGDIASGLCAADVDISEETELFIDIGTNGELAVGGREKLICCATAAGPAFEGACIECGMSGTEGAVNTILPVKAINAADAGKYRQTPDGLFGYTVIGGGEPRGICGSALIDLIAVLLDAEIIDETGMLEDDYILCESGNIRLTPRDVREVQLAKAAIAAGIYTMCEHGGIKINEVSAVKLAGGFGAFLKVSSACRIGLIPYELAEKVAAVGNTSGAGAAHWLLDENFRERIAHIRDHAEYVELSGDKRFNNYYMEQMCFGE
ncbi:MAG: ASKHA domain-containing protein [Eubacteriales bacterium]